MFSAPESLLPGAAFLLPVSYLCGMMLYPLGTDSAQPSITLRRGRGQWMDQCVEGLCPAPLVSVRMGG